MIYYIFLISKTYDVALRFDVKFAGHCGEGRAVKTIPREDERRFVFIPPTRLVFPDTIAQRQGTVQLTAAVDIIDRNEIRLSLA